MCNAFNKYKKKKTRKGGFFFIFFLLRVILSQFFQFNVQQCQHRALFFHKYIVCATAIQHGDSLSPYLAIRHSSVKLVASYSPHLRSIRHSQGEATQSQANTDLPVYRETMGWCVGTSSSSRTAVCPNLTDKMFHIY